MGVGLSDNLWHQISSFKVVFINKQLLTSEPVLVHYREHKPPFFTIDISPYEFGDVPSHKMGYETPIANYSRVIPCTK